MTSSDIQNPNIAVLQKLFTYRQTLLKYLKSKASSLSDQALQDIVDLVLLSASRSDNLDLSDETKLLNYLKRICYNEMLDFKKAQYRTSSKLLDSNLSGISAPDPAELHSQRELITEAINRIKQISSPDEFTLFTNHIQSHLDDKRVDRRFIQEKYGWSAAKLNQMTASLNMKIKLVKTQILAVPLFLWDLPRKLLRGHASNAEAAATVASSTTTAGGATILSIKAVPVVLVATTIVGGGAMVYQHHDPNAKKPHIVHKPPTADRPKEVAAPPQIPVVDKQTVSKTKPSTPKPHKRRRHHRPRRLHQQQHSQPAASPSVSSKNTPPPPPSAPPPKPKPAPSPASSSKGEGDAEFGVDGP